MIRCERCDHVPVPDEDLPVELPEFVDTTGNPLDAAEEWKHVECPDCGGDAVRETDTMNTFVDSSWYFLRFVSPDLDSAPFDGELASDWMPVDQYVGGIEHAVMHLLYARFFTKVLDDIDLLDGVREPFRNLMNQGMVLGEDGRKMSKSGDNGVSPQRIIDEYGADTARLFIMDAAHPERDFPWDPEGVRSSHQMLQSFYRLAADYDADAVEADDSTAADYVSNEIDATIATATEEFSEVRFNRALQEIGELISLLRRYSESPTPAADVLERGVATTAKLLAPAAPHVAEEIWMLLDRDGLIAEADWPSADCPADYDLERRLVENTRTDIRDIVETAGITDPETITIVVAPEWKHRAHGIAMDADDNVVGAVMSNEEMVQHDNAPSFAKDLAAEAQALKEQLPPNREYEALRRAGWLLRNEFDAEVAVRMADEVDSGLARKSAPGRPAIDIEE